MDLGLSFSLLQIYDLSKKFTGLNLQVSKGLLFRDWTAVLVSIDVINILIGMLPPLITYPDAKIVLLYFEQLLLNGFKLLQQATISFGLFCHI